MIEACSLWMAFFSVGADPGKATSALNEYGSWILFVQNAV